MGWWIDYDTLYARMRALDQFYKNDAYLIANGEQSSYSLQSEFHAKAMYYLLF